MAFIVTMTVACRTPIERREGSPAPATAPETRAPTIDHLTPRRDSVGGTPTRFAWTPIDGADAYEIAVWDEVDVLVWKASRIPGPSVTWPPEARLEPGTYFWTVTAFRDGRPVAESGRSAFVVR